MGRIRTETVCPECDGKGKTIRNKCNTCHGEGRVRNTSKIRVRIPSGVEDGQTLTLPGKGEAGLNGGLYGDLYINISVKPHELFIRDGLDIYLEMPVTFSQAALGASLDIPTLTGTNSLKIPAGTQTSTKFKISGKGITNGRTNQTGNLYVVVNVVTPTRLSSEQKDLFNRLANTKENTSDTTFEKIKNFFKRNFS
jgi:molecular chaperone DnaJ